MELLRFLHSWTRWAVLIVAVIVLVIVGILVLPSGIQWQFRGS